MPGINDAVPRGQYKWIITDTVDLIFNDLLHRCKQFAAGAVNVRHTPQTVRILNYATLLVRSDNLASGKDTPDVARALTLPGMFL